MSILSGISGTVGAIAGAVLGGLVVFGGLSTYNALIENPSIRKETTAIVEAKARQQTEAAINEVDDQAERARAMRRHCRDIGVLYNSATGKCRQ
jgi:hypothetical protein